MITDQPAGSADELYHCCSYTHECKEQFFHDLALLIIIKCMFVP